MDGDERLRLFCALLLPPEAIDGLVAWQAAELPRDKLRIVPRENLHVTLAFLGNTPAARLGEVADALSGARADTEPPVLAPVRYRETKSVAMIELSDEGGRAGALATRLQSALEALGVYRREARKWLPHVTVARFRERPRLSPALPARGSIVPSDAAVMISRLRPGGAQYEVFESVSLGG
ncbi:MAG TPA: RNA 2',3'-cyclic phosphodiesterase [Gaiellaceae bacterium]|nr:RNA 2',3'-cyclic phosphodiesterase [Gaiellaceae bacterium]